MAAAVQPVEVKKQSWREALSTVGPGLVFMLSSVGPRDLVSNSIAGATVGGSLLWVLVVALVIRMVILDASARFVLVTGKSLLGGIGDMGRWAAWAFFGLSVLRRHAQSLVRLMLLGTAAHFVLPLPTPHSVAIWGIGSWTIGFVLLFWGRYRLVEDLSKPISATLGLCLVLAAVLSRPDMADFARTALQPSMPLDSGVHSPMLVLIAIVSGAIGSMGNLKYSAYVHEKRWRSLDHLRSQRLDLAISMFAMLVMLALIQVAAAGALRPRGLEVADIKDLVPIFAQVLGGAGQILLGVTLWCVVFSQHITSGAGYGIMVSDVYHRFMRKSEDLIAERVAPSQLPAYRWMVLYACLSPLYVFATDWSPVGMVLGYGLISIIGLPLIAGMVIALTSNRKVMGEHANGWFTNIVLSLTVISAIYVSWEGVLDLMKTLRKV